MRAIAELAAAVRTGKLTASAVAATALERAERSQPTLNAFTSIDREGATARAAAIDAVVAAGGDPGPLAGVPVGLKDLIDQEGIATTNGAAFDPVVAERSATVVRRLEDAGAVIIGRTGLHEFAFGFTSENPHFGPVRNPWDTDLSPGGSSGGSGAAVAAGVVPMAIGTDTGGSVRVPAALCGVVGLKVTHGRIPLTGVTALAPSLDTVGPLARSVADAALAYAVIAGPDDADPWTAPLPAQIPTRPVDLAGLRIGVPEQWTRAPTSHGTRRAFASTLDALSGRGAKVEHLDEPELTVTQAARNGVLLEILSVHGERWSAHPERYGDDAAERMRAIESVPASDAAEAVQWEESAGAALRRLLGRFDVLATPTVGSTRKVIGIDTIDIDGEMVPHRAALATFTWPVNSVGNPALALPIPGSGAPPASVQLIGGRFGEERLLAIGLALEAAGIIGAETPPSYLG